jgi:regulator of sigma E protease
VTPNENGKIGISLAMIKVPVGNPLEASVRSAQYLSNTIRLQFVAFGEMFQGKMNVKDLSGPISLVNVGSNQIEKNGIQSGLMLTAIISTILAVMNVLPIPALDGGHIFFLIIEALKGSPVKQEIREQVTQFGFLGLLGLIAFVLLNDINNTFINPVKLP